LFSTDSETQFEISKNGKATLHTRALKIMKPVESSPVVSGHDREKIRFVDIHRPFLTALGITDQQQRLIPSMSRKWKQINKFIEVFSQAFGVSPLATDRPVQIVDFGSGKGYLTFALHDYLRHTLHNAAEVTGVELREELVALCNAAAAKLDHTGLSFVCGDVKTHAPEKIDVMIALHACDTATDYAIHYGIRANASIIMCSPCCHKQLRPQLHSPALLQPMLQFGVHMGQEAEMVTDSLRALLLEANGYDTKVFEFVSLEHTNKNKMILAVKKSTPTNPDVILKQIADIKQFYGITEHCLETLLKKS
jgi:SAM-dependent methyltransferase